jgi:hypothetical protein
MMNTTTKLGMDAGNGAYKLAGGGGFLELQSQVAMNGGQKVMSTLGLRKSKAPLQISNDNGSFYVGPFAHDHGRPVENLDVDRFNGTPEMRALFQGSLTEYQRKYGAFTSPLSITVGLPNEILTGDSAEKNVDTVKQWMRGTHTWNADGEPFSVEVADVKVASQVTGGLFDYLLDAEGRFIPDRKGAFSGEVGTISIGFGTVELMVVRNRTPVQRFTTGATSGVRRLLEIVNGQRLYSLGELDMQLRAGQLDVSAALPIWEREVMGVIEKQWGSAWKRFAVVLLMGGGSILLKDTLPYRFNGKAHVPDHPVIAIARGLYKLSLFQQARKEKG